MRAMFSAGVCAYMLEQETKEKKKTAMWLKASLNSATHEKKKTPNV